MTNFLTVKTKDLEERAFGNNYTGAQCSTYGCPRRVKDGNDEGLRIGASTRIIFCHLFNRTVKEQKQQWNMLKGNSSILSNAFEDSTGR